MTRPLPSVQQIQAELGVSQGYAAIARRLLIVSDPRITEALLEHRVTLVQADRIAKLPYEDRAEALANPGRCNVARKQTPSVEVDRLRAHIKELEAKVRRLRKYFGAQ